LAGIQVEQHKHPLSSVRDGLGRDGKAVNDQTSNQRRYSAGPDGFVGCPGTSSATGGRSITLTTSALSGLSEVRSWKDFAKFLTLIQTGSGASYADLQKRTRSGTRTGARELTRSTVSAVLRGERAPRKSVLESLLAAWRLPAAECALILETWTRLTVDSRERRSGLPQFAEMSPRELGVHAAMQSPDAPDELPGYVARHFDDDLRRLIRAGTQRGCFVLLVGGSSTGKTRSLYEAVRAIASQWWLVQPSDTEEIHQLLEEPTQRTVVWLDELHRFFGSSPPLTKVVVAKLKKAGLIVVGTLWFDDYAARKELRPSGAVDHLADDRGLLGFADVIGVPPRFREDEHRAAEKLAVTDNRIRAALEVTDAGLTQVLAAGPDLLHLWDQAPPYARAAITVAADARRLGILSPLSPDVLVEAMAGYLTPAERVTTPDRWLHEVTSYATRPVHGTVAALSRVAGRHPGTLAGYVAADYLAQHLRLDRRTECPPESFWEALIDRLDSTDDIRRMCDAAAARMRYRIQERALRRLSALGDGQAPVDLAYLLVRQDRIDAAVSVLVEPVRDRPDDKKATDALADVITLRGRADALRATDWRTRRHLAEFLHDRGESADLRTEADRGDIVAADELAYLLAERGGLADLRERADAGHRLAADLMAELLATHQRLRELGTRAAAGDQAAAARLSKIQASEPGTGSAAADLEITTLREAAAEGRPHAAEQLTSLLFELRHEEELRAEVDAGTRFAADRLLALLMADRSDDEAAAEDVLRLRAFGLHPDGTLAPDRRK
jgi:hypothetical protein